MSEDPKAKPAGSGTLHTPGIGQALAEQLAGDQAARTRNDPMKLMAEKLRSRRGKKKVLARRPTKAKCPAPGCSELVDTPMCPKHWPLVSRETRKELLHELRAMRLAGQRRPPAGKPSRIVELYLEAIREVVAAQPQGASHVDERPSGPAVANLAPPPPLRVHEVVSALARSRGAEARPEGRPSTAGLIVLPTREQSEEFGSGHGPRDGAELQARTEGRRPGGDLPLRRR